MKKYYSTIFFSDVDASCHVTTSPAFSDAASACAFAQAFIEGVRYADDNFHYANFVCNSFIVPEDNA